MERSSPEHSTVHARPIRATRLLLPLLLGLLLGGCDDGPRYSDPAWCNALNGLADPLPELFDGLAGPQKVADDYVLRDGYSSGIVIATVSDTGTSFYATGDTRWAGGVAVNPDTVFEIASITKVFTSLLLADAVLRGELDLDDPVSRYLPDDVDFPDSIRLRHLATHTAGLPREARGFNPEPFDSWYERYDLEDFYGYLDGFRPSTEPGTRYSYSNLGSYLLGHVLTRQTGMSYEALLTSRVFLPLEMDSTHVYDEPPGVQLATPYDHRNVETDYFMVPAIDGFGQIRSTTRDMAQFTEAALGLRSTSLDEAFALAQALHYAGPVAQGGQTESGLGLGRIHVGGSTLVGHEGGSWGFRTSILLDLDQQTGTVVLTNSRHTRDCLVGFLTFWLSEWQRTAVLGDGALAEYPGDYALPSGTASITLDGSHLFAALPGQAAAQRIYPEGNDRFFTLLGDTELEFERDGSGNVSGLRVRTSADPRFAD